MKKTYPTYKETEIPWLPEIPSDWEIKKMKFVSSLRFSNVDKHSFDHEQPVSLCNYTDVYYNDFIDSSLSFMSATASHSEIEKFQISKGDVLVTKDSESWDDIAVPALVVESLEDTLCGYHLALIKTNGQILFGSYLFRLLQSENINTHFKISANGITRYGLSISAFSNVLIPLPSLPEQRQIAAYLDHKCALIDTFIAKKKRLIELLQEQKQAIINQAVTRGIDPDVPLKPSGVEWLGDIPAHWEVKKLKYVLSISGGYAFNSSNFKATGIQLVRIGNLYRNQLRLDRQPIFLDEALLDEHSDFVIKKGDLLISLTGTIGKRDYGYAVLVEETRPMFLNQRVGRLSCNEQVKPRFALLMLNSEVYLNQIFRLPSGTKQANLSNANVVEPKMPLPPLKEQIEIINYIDQESEVIEQTIARVEKEIELIQEYKTTLIAEAVTGRIDVRGWEVEEKIPSQTLKPASL